MAKMAFHFAPCSFDTGMPQIKIKEAAAAATVAAATVAAATGDNDIRWAGGEMSGQNHSSLNNIHI